MCAFINNFVGVHSRNFNHYHDFPSRSNSFILYNALDFPTFDQRHLIGRPRHLAVYPGNFTSFLFGSKPSNLRKVSYPSHLGHPNRTFSAPLMSVDNNITDHENLSTISDLQQSIVGHDDDHTRQLSQIQHINTNYMTDSSSLQSSFPIPSITSTCPDIPILNALLKEKRQIRAPFFCPGHKQGNTVHPAMFDVTGRQPMWSLDIPELPNLDNLYAPDGCIKEAQERAADVFAGGRDNASTFFLVNGCTAGVVASIVAVCTNTRSPKYINKEKKKNVSSRQRKIILPRNAHQSAIYGLVLSGAVPVYIDPLYDPKRDTCHGMTLESIENALLMHPGEIDAVLVTSPTYHGVISDIATIADLVHKHGATLIVDEAHGAHLGLCQSRYPQNAIALGADIVAQSTHKTLSSLTQTAMLHVRKSKYDKNENSNDYSDVGIIPVSCVARALQLGQSSSPNNIFLASLDATRALIEAQGEQLLLRAADLADFARAQLSKMPHIAILDQLPEGMKALDPGRLTVFTDGLGMDGFQVDEILIEEFGVYCEFPSLHHLTFIVSIGNTKTHIDLMIQAFNELSIRRTESLAQLSSSSSSILSSLNSLQLPSKQPRGTLRMPPREAYFSSQQTIRLSEAQGRISATTISPYPPGIPVLVAGEEISLSCIQYLINVSKAGGTITGLAKPDDLDEEEADPDDLWVYVVNDGLLE